MTLNLLFPVVGDGASRAILEREVTRLGLDPYFLEPFHIHYSHHRHPRDAVDPTDVHGLYYKFPRWGERLHELWNEADDPTPITAIGKWADSRRSPRFTYWCTVVGISIAVLFGMLAAGLAAVQVWIAYCTWVGDPQSLQCGYNNRLFISGLWFMD